MRKLFLLLALHGLNASAATNGVVAGRVVDRTTQKPSQGSIVRLSIFRGDEMIAGAEGKTDHLGNFNFLKLDPDPSLRYRARALISGVPFDGNFGKFQSGQLRLELGDLHVSPVTGDPSHIMSDEFVIFEFGRANLLKITHSIKFANEGDVTYDPRADGGKKIEISLPEGGSRLEFGAGLDAETAQLDPNKHILQFRLQIKPGPVNERRVEFGYLYSYESRSLPFDFPLSVARRRFLILLADRDLPLKSARLKAEGEKKLDQHTYHLYGGGPFKPGESTAFTLSDLPREKDLPIRLMLGGVSIVVIGGIFLVLKRKKTVTAPKELERECFAKLTELEQKRRSGSISESEYRRQREQLSEILIEVRTKERPNQAA